MERCRTEKKYAVSGGRSFKCSESIVGYNKVVVAELFLQVFHGRNDLHVLPVPFIKHPLQIRNRRFAWGNEGYVYRISCKGLCRRYRKRMGILTAQDYECSMYLRFSRQMVFTSLRKGYERRLNQIRRPFKPYGRNYVQKVFHASRVGVSFIQCAYRTFFGNLFQKRLGT